MKVTCKTHLRQVNVQDEMSVCTGSYPTESVTHTYPPTYPPLSLFLQLAQLRLVRGHHLLHGHRVVVLQLQQHLH